MTKNLKLTLVIVAVAAAVLGVAAMMSRPDTPAAMPPVGQTDGPPPRVPAELLVRADSHRLSTAPDGKVTLVEFLDFECESCGAAYPAIEQLRKEYGNRITYVVRYFPIQSHRSAQLAAQVAEAAAQQGQFEPMYRKLFDNQKVWAEKPEPQRDVLFGYARELGLDMNKFQAAVDDPGTAKRIRKDSQDGTAAGVQGTPTFFLNGAQIEPTSLQDLRNIINAELAK